MKKKQLWVQRTFDFDFPAEDFPKYVEKLRSTPERLEKMVSNLSGEMLTRKEGETWSIQENAGHLIEVEVLFDGRLNDYEEKLTELRPADMTNKSTYSADFNALDIKAILKDFRSSREAFMQRIDLYNPEAFAHSAFHPRLKKQMRLVDMLQFQVEHDDHHLKQIEDLIERFSAS